MGLFLFVGSGQHCAVIFLPTVYPVCLGLLVQGWSVSGKMLVIHTASFSDCCSMCGWRILKHPKSPVYNYWGSLEIWGSLEVSAGLILPLCSQRANGRTFKPCQGEVKAKIKISLVHCKTSHPLNAACCAHSSSQCCSQFFPLVQTWFKQQVISE